MKALPWQEWPKPDYMNEKSNTMKVEPETFEKSNTLNLSLFDVTGPYNLSAYVLAYSGQNAIDALTHHPDSPWAKIGVWDEQCQAEYIGQTLVPKKNWFYLLANMGDTDSPHGLIMSKAL